MYIFAWVNVYQYKETMSVGGADTFSHLKGFTEHVFSFFAAKQVDDHLFTVQPPQRSEMSESDKYKHNNIARETAKQCQYLLSNMHAWFK